MIDDNFKVLLIECNTNPCLAVPCPLLSCLISKIVDNTFRVTLDPIFGVGDKAISNFTDIKGMMIFDEEVEKEEL